MYSIPVHECTECVKQMCMGILSRDDNAIVILHVSSTDSIKNFEFNNDRIIVNPKQFNTSWGWDSTRIHVSNYKYAKQQNDIGYVIFLSSNCLMLNPIPTDTFLYDAGFSEYILNDNTKNTPPILNKSRHDNWWVQKNIESDKRFISLENELKWTARYGCMIDASFVNVYIMDMVVYFYEKYFNYDELTFALEEILIPSIACNFTTNITSSLLTYNYNFNIYEYENSNDIIFIKPIERSMNNTIRQKYDYNIYERITNGICKK